MDLCCSGCGRKMRHRTGGGKYIKCARCKPKALPKYAVRKAINNTDTIVLWEPDLTQARDIILLLNKAVNDQRNKPLFYLGIRGSTA